MSRSTSAVLVSLLTLALAASLVGCSRASSSSIPSTSSAPNCSQLFETTINYARSDAAGIDSFIQSLNNHCPIEYDIVVGYLAHSGDSEYRIDSCDELLDYDVNTRSVELLEEDGLCTFAAVDPAAGPEAVPGWSDGAVTWDSAGTHAGTVQRVCGPLMSTRETADGTFFNVGMDYPSVARFTIIFWDIYLQPIENGATLCGTGAIYLYDGVAQMEMSEPSALEIWP